MQNTMQNTIVEVDAEALAHELQSGQQITIVDVRDAWEHTLGHLPGAQLLPLTEMPQRLTELTEQKNAAIVTYCHHGMRSLKAAHKLCDAGFSNVRSLRGGIDAWSQRVDSTVGRY